MSLSLRNGITRRARARRFRLPLVARAFVAGLIPTAALADPPRPPWHPGDPWVVTNPASPELLHISNLFWVMLVLSGIIFIGVCGVLFYSAVHFRVRPGEPEPTQVFGNKRVELIWTVVPTTDSHDRLCLHCQRHGEHQFGARLQKGLQRQRHRSSVVVGIPVPTAGDRNRERASHSHRRVRALSRRVVMM